MTLGAANWLNPKQHGPPIVAEAGTVVILRDGALHTMQVPFATRSELERLLEGLPPMPPC